VGRHHGRVRQRQGHAPGAGLSTETGLRGRRDSERASSLRDRRSAVQSSLVRPSATSRRSGRISRRASGTSPGTRRRRPGRRQAGLDGAVRRRRRAQVQAADAAVTNARLSLDWTKLLADRRRRRDRAGGSATS
jgi:hypothetical protein